MTRFAGNVCPYLCPLVNSHIDFLKTVFSSFFIVLGLNHYFDIGNIAYMLGLKN